MYFHTIRSEVEARELNSKLPALISLDVETTGLDPHTDKIISAQIAVSESEAYYIPAKYLYLLNRLFQCVAFLHNFKFDYKFLTAAHVPVPITFRDTLLLHHLIDENSEHGLDFLVRSFYNDNYKEKFWQKYQSIEEASEDDLLEYSCKDVIYTYRLGKMFISKLYNKRNLIDHVHRLAYALYLTEREGLDIDWNRLDALKTEYQLKSQLLQIQLRESVWGECAGWELAEWQKELGKRKTDRGKANVAKPIFNFESNKQLGELLYDVLGLPEKTGKTGNRTVDDAALTDLEGKHPVITFIREFRQCQKILSTYIDGLITKKIGNRLYPEFVVTGTVTGRISHKNPNMGNWPRDASIRQALVPKDGHKLIDADYGQIEIALAAHFSKDPVLINIVKTGQSMHDNTAKAVNLKRQDAKTLNFAVIYGAQEYKISKTLGTSLELARDILDRLWKTYTGLKRIIDECHRKVDRGEPIVNLFGRERRFGTRFESHWDRERAKRQAFNALVQGTAADLCNRSFYLMSERLRANGHGRALFTVHDEIICEVKQEYAEEEAKALTDIMVKCGQELELLVPLTAECKILDCWSK